VSHEFKYELDKVRQNLVIHRMMAYRHALKHAGYTPQSIDLALERNREWIQSGDWTGEPKR
jgi:hypothetical protein